jgi:hypothetical protein
MCVNSLNIKEMCKKIAEDLVISKLCINTHTHTHTQSYLYIVITKILVIAETRKSQLSLRLTGLFSLPQ